MRTGGGLLQRYLVRRVAVSSRIDEYVYIVM